MRARLRRTAACAACAIGWLATAATLVTGGATEMLVAMLAVAAMALEARGDA